MLVYQWLEDSLRLGEKVCEDTYNVEVILEEKSIPNKALVSASTDGNASNSDEPSPHTKKMRSSSVEDVKNSKPGEENNAVIDKAPDSPAANSGSSALTLSPPAASISPRTPTSSSSSPGKDVRVSN